MDYDSIYALFALYIGDSDTAEKYAAFVNGAIVSVQNMLLDNADETDSRLTPLAAAIAYYRFRLLLATRDRPALTAAGTVTEIDNAQEKIDHAAKLVRDARRACRDLLRDDKLLLRAV